MASVIDVIDKSYRDKIEKCYNVNIYIKSYIVYFHFKLIGKMLLHL